MTRWPLLSLVFAGCSSGAIVVSDPVGDTEAATGDTGDTSGDTQLEDSGPDSTPDTAPVQGLDLWAHQTIESLVTVRWEQLEAATAWVEYSVGDDQWLTSPAFEAAAGEHQQLLLGIPYGLAFTWRIVNDRGAGLEYSPDQSAVTAPLPEVLLSDPEAWAEGDNWLYASINESAGGWTSGDYWQFIMDRQGRIVWALKTPERHWTIYVRVSQDGDDLLWDDATYWVNYSGHDSQVHRMKIDGTVVATYDTPGLHHAFTELDDGSLVWGAVDGRSETLEKLSPGGEQQRIWDCAEFNYELGVDKYCQSNALYWHAETDTFLYSFYTTSTVIHVDHATGDSLAWWGDISGWEFDPAESAFDWQHGATFTEEGTLLLSTHSSHTTSECAAREYRLNPEGETLTEVWSYGVGEGLDCTTAGEAHRLSNGNTLHNLGAGARLREITPDGRLVWDVAWPDGQDRGRLLGRSIFLNDLYAFAP